jgi:hypothetical protein
VAQPKAIEEIRALKTDNALRNHVEGLLFRWRIYVVESQDKLTSDDKELIMNLSQIYQDWREKTLREGQKEGQKEERSLFVENLLRFRFGKIDEALLPVVKRLLNLPAQDSSRLILQSSREELLAKLS